MTATVLHLLNSAGVSLLVNDERRERCWSDQLLRHRDVRNHRPCKGLDAYRRYGFGRGG